MKVFFNITVGIWVFFAAVFSFVPKDVLASEGFYANASAGATWVKDALEYTDGNTKIKGKMDTGYGLLMALGHDFGLIRLEAELSHFSSDIDSVSIAANKYTTSGEISSTSLMLNGYLELENETPFTPYIGGGVGYARVKVAGKAAMGGLFNTTIRWNDTDNVFAYQGITGITYALNDNFLFDLSYRYFVTEDFSVTGTSNWGFSETGKINYKSQSVMAGIRWYFK